MQNLPLCLPNGLNTVRKLITRIAGECLFTSCCHVLKFYFIPRTTDFALTLQAFDELLLLKPGGETVFSGSLGHQQLMLIDHFQAVDGVAR